MLKCSLFALLMLFSVLPGAALAETVVKTCGVPQTGQAETDPGGTYCNIHDRRLAYARENVKFRNDLEQRRKNFVAPQQEALGQYQDAVKSYYDSNESEQSGSPAHAEDETAGPPVPDAAGLNP